ncbi:MAG TPA: TolC family protein, partial [Bacteroidota bacterium]
HHDHLEKVISVIADLKSAYAMLWYARTASELTRENQQLVELILSSAQTRYAVGGTSQQDVLKTNIELAKLKTKEASLRQEEIAAESMMRAILNRSSARPIGQISLEPVRTLRYSVDDLLAFGLANKPMLVHDSLSVHEQDLMVSLTRQEYLPDLSLSLEYVTSPLLGHKQWSFMVGITLPFAPWTLGKASARVQEAQSERSMMASKYQASKNMLQARIREQYAAVKAYETEILYYENTILPQTRQSLQALMSEYQTGSASYLMLLDSYRMYQEISMDAAMARMKYEQSRARLEREVGVTDLRVVPTAEEE